MPNVTNIVVDGIRYDITDTATAQALAAETAAREQADTQLSQKISAETTARQQADNQLSQQISAETAAREQADNLINSNLGDIISAMIYSGIDIQSARKLYAYAAPSEGQDSIVTALAKCDGTEPTFIFLSAGTYDIGAAFPPNAYPTGMVLPNNVYFYGNDAAENIVLRGHLSSTNQLWSPVNTSGNNGLFNLTVDTENCRYCVHDDNSNVAFFHRVYKNCIFRGNNNALYYAYGGGIRGGSTVKFENCTFVNNNVALLMHNWVGSTQPATLEINDCRFYVTSAAKAIDIQSMTENSAGNSVHGDFIVSIKGTGCTAGLANLKEGAGNPGGACYAKMLIDEGVRLMENVDATITVASQLITMPMLDTVAKGDVVQFVNGGCKKFAGSIAYSCANGFCIDTDENNAIIITKGFWWMPSTGISGYGGGQYLQVDNSNGAVTPVGAPGQGTFAVITQDNFAWFNFPIAFA